MSAQVIDFHASSPATRRAVTEEQRIRARLAQERFRFDQIWSSADEVQRVLEIQQIRLPRGMVRDIQVARERFFGRPTRDDSQDRALVRWLLRICERAVWDFVATDCNPQLDPGPGGLSA